MRLRSVLRRLKRLGAPHPDWERHSVDEWNSQYAASAWKYLGSLEQVPRYAVIEGWRRRLRPGGSVLDLGCGEGMVLEQIPAAERVHYTGIDLSQVAIGAAVRKISNAAVQRFICADLVTFEPVSGTTFDVVVFNEVLYYLQDPIAALLRYRAFSAPDGIVIVSVFHENRRTWKALCTLLAKQCIQQTVVSDISSSKRWYLGLYEAHPSMAAPTLSR